MAIFNDDASDVIRNIQEQNIFYTPSGYSIDQGPPKSVKFDDDIVYFYNSDYKSKNNKIISSTGNDITFPNSTDVLINSSTAGQNINNKEILSGCHINQSYRTYKITETYTNYSLSATDQIIICKAGVQITLPNISVVGTGKRYVIVNETNGLTYINRTSPDIIGVHGETQITLIYQRESVELISCPNNVWNLTENRNRIFMHRRKDATQSITPVTDTPISFPTLIAQKNYSGYISYNDPTSTFILGREGLYHIDCESIFQPGAGTHRTAYILFSGDIHRYSQNVAAHIPSILTSQVLSTTYYCLSGTTFKVYVWHNDPAPLGHSGPNIYDASDIIITYLG